MAVIKKARRTAFVPRLLVRTAIAGVIPACAVACGSSDTPAPAADAGTDSPFLGVAAVAYPAYEAGADSPFLGVAAVAYPAYEAGAPDAAADARGPADATDDVFFLGVAAVAYPAYEAGPPGSAVDGGPADARPDVFHGFVLAVTAYEVDRPKES